MSEGFDVPGRVLDAIQTADMAGRHKCRVCGKVFVTMPGYAWRFDVKGHPAWFCRYNHMREYERMLEAERQKKREEAAENYKPRQYSRVWKQTKRGCSQRLMNCLERLDEYQAEFDVTTDNYRRKNLQKMISAWKLSVKEAEDALKAFEEAKV